VGALIVILIVLAIAVGCACADVVHEGALARWRTGRRARRVRRRRAGTGELDAALSRRARIQTGRDLAAAHVRIAAELEARTPSALREMVGASALSTAWLNSEHGERTLHVSMSDDSALVLGPMAEPSRRELISMLRDGPARLVSVSRDAVAFRLQFIDLLGTRCTIWSRLVRVIDDARVGPAGP
jgi:hypothetical protein